ncbi:MAG: thioredoxin family protein [Flavobacteriaceae bacterium]|nr:thioredoxin family protein [Flavobacteriaceae bacterium]
MKKLILMFSFFSSVMAFSQVKWMTMNQALEAQKKSPKKILIHFYAQWCSMCKKMENHTYTNPEIAKYINDNYYAVKFDAEGGEKVEYQGKIFENPTYDPNRKIKYGGNGSYNQFASLMNIRSYPTMVILDESSEYITNFIGYFNPKAVEPYLAVIATDAYKNITSKELWEQYVEKFQHKVKE